MRKINRKQQHSIKIEPRWPYRSVLISERALAQLEAAQIEVHREIENVRLILTRGYETYYATTARKIPRMLGSFLFATIYPSRRNECAEIFSPNGHDESGDHVDVSIEISGRKLGLLPFGVWTSSERLDSIQEENNLILSNVWAALRKSGFQIHTNRTESFQIHCDLD